MKKKIIFIFIIILVGVVLVYSFKLNKEETKTSYASDVVGEVDVNGDSLNVNYVKGNMIDEKLIYGNSFSKTIMVTNKNDKQVSFAISLKEREISNELVTYSVYATTNEMEEEIVKDKNINDDNLIYNLGLEANSELKIKIVFTSNKEGIETNIKGRLVVATNLTEKEIFIQNTKLMQEALIDKIDDLNGVSVANYYYINANELNTSFNGTILIDARDISDLKYYYSIYSGKYALDDYQYNNDLSKKNVVDYVSILDQNQLCLAHTKKGCLPFSSITYNESGGEKTFLSNSKKVLNSVKSSFNKTDKKVYIIDVSTDISNDTNIRGYVLANNTVENVEYYLYLTDNVYMISGYNYTKYGEYNEDTGTIRSYKETSFNLSSKDKYTVCNFSGFSECYSMNEEKV